mmetsp:Transcript_4330/g.11923  ORF Transcript_4330/g.11923 Transcript_4330/m.11923 type:complete len:271 (-) Transcript_4330:419-1231(-)
MTKPADLAESRPSSIVAAWAPATKAAPESCPGRARGPSARPTSRLSRRMAKTKALTGVTMTRRASTKTLATRLATALRETAMLARCSLIVLRSAAAVKAAPQRCSRLARVALERPIIGPTRSRPKARALIGVRMIQIASPRSPATERAPLLRAVTLRTRLALLLNPRQLFLTIQSCRRLRLKVGPLDADHQLRSVPAMAVLKREAPVLLLGADMRHQAAMRNLPLLLLIGGTYSQNSEPCRSCHGLGFTPALVPATRCIVGTWSWPRHAP